jgi:multidrug efflux pump subunit AcrA (membrane-fusion protein)
MKIAFSALLAVCMATPLSAAELPLLTLTPLQIERAGISTLRPRLPGSSPEDAHAGSQSRLSGTVMVPNAGLNTATAPLAGVLQKLRVDPLEVVRAGQPLAEIYSADYLTLQQGYLEAKSAAQLADTRATRDEMLFRDGIIAASRLEESKVKKLQADALYEEHRQSLKIAGLSDATLARLRTAEDLSAVLVVSARMSGSVLEQLATPGQRLESGTPIFRIADTAKLWIELHAAASESALIRPGDIVTAAGCDRPGRIVSASQQLSSATQSVTLRAEFDTPGTCLKPNQYVEVTVAAGKITEKAIGIPASSIVRSGGKDFVFAREANGFRPTQIEIIARGGDLVWARSVLRPDVEIANRGVATLRGAWTGLGPDSLAAQ